MSTSMLALCRELHSLVSRKATPASEARLVWLCHTIVPLLGDAKARREAVGVFGLATAACGQAPPARPHPPTASAAASTERACVAPYCLAPATQRPHPLGTTHPLLPPPTQRSRRLP